IATAALKIVSKCSFIRHKLRFFDHFCLALAASITFFNNLLNVIRYGYILTDKILHKPNDALSL
ncbi:hypothetical protein N9J26_01415, partial [bacterium]|nr:hypothetical protein [bacterium]